MMLAACGQKAQETSSEATSDTASVGSTSSLEGMAGDESSSQWLSSDLQMHCLKGQVKKVSTTIYQSDKNGKQDFERHKTLLTFDAQGLWTGNERAKFKASDITRDSQGRITKLSFRHVLSKEEDYGCDYDYTYTYTPKGMLAKMGEEFVGEICGGFEFVYTYDDDGNIASYTQSGVGDGVGVEATVTVTIKETDSHGNWTKSLIKDGSTTTEEYDGADGQPKLDKNTETDYSLQVRKIEYYE